MPVHFDDTFQPSNIFEALNVILEGLTKDERAYVKAEGTTMLHHGPGTAMRNGWNLWGTIPEKPTVLREYFMKEFGIGHADDMSGMILDALEIEVREGRTFTMQDAVEKAGHYKEFWRKQNIDPLTQKKSRGR